MAVRYESRVAQVVKNLDTAEARTLQSMGIAVTGWSFSLSPYKTGNLRNSIRYDLFPDHVRIGTPVEYGIYQELGTRFMSAQPFLVPAAVNNTDRLREIAVREMGKIE